MGICLVAIFIEQIIDLLMICFVTIFSNIQIFIIVNGLKNSYNKAFNISSVSASSVDLSIRHLRILGKRRAIPDL